MWCVYIYICIHIRSHKSIFIVTSTHSIIYLSQENPVGMQRLRPAGRELPLAVHAGAPIGMVALLGSEQYTPTMAMF